MKLKKIALVSAMILNSQALFGAEPAIECSNELGYTAKLVFEEAQNVGTLTYGKADNLTTITDLATSFYGGVGAAVKGNEVLFVVTPAFPKKLAELVVDGSTYLLQCN